MKYVLNVFRGSSYNRYTFKEAIGDYVEAHKSDWANKWPSTKGEIVELWDQMLNKSVPNGVANGDKPMGEDFYTITVDTQYLPEGITSDLIPV